MRPYKVFLNFEVLASIQMSRAAHERVFGFIRSLGENPYQSCDFFITDHESREHHMKIVAGYVVDYWLDVPVHMVMIVAIRPAE